MKKQIKFAKLITEVIEMLVDNGEMFTNEDAVGGVLDDLVKADKLDSNEARWLRASLLTSTVEIFLRTVRSGWAVTGIDPTNPSLKMFFPVTPAMGVARRIRKIREELNVHRTQTIEAVGTCSCQACRTRLSA